MKLFRSCLPALLLLSLLSFTTTARAETPAPAAKDAEVKPETAPVPVSKGMRIAVLPVVNGTGEEDANSIMEDVLRDEFKMVDPAKAVFLMPQDVERILDDANATERAYKLTDRWHKSGQLDSTAVAGLDSLLVADAVMMVSVGEWESKRAHNIGEGQSNTTVSLHFAIFRIHDRKRIWIKDEREQRFARELDVSSATVGYDETGRVQTPNAMEPPRVHDVAADLVRDALKKFPGK